MSWTRWSWLLLLLSGCATEGELARGTFDYECVTDEDAACWELLSPAGVPASIAVGARFRLEFTPYEPIGVYTVAPASIERAFETSGVLTLTDDGVQAMLATDKSDNVVDFVMVRGVDVADLFVSEIEDDEAMPLSSLAVEEGDMATFFARPVALDGTTLAGALEFSWSVEDEGVATVEVSAESTAACTITAQSVGSTDLTVTAGGLDVTFYLEVEAAP